VFSFAGGTVLQRAAAVPAACTQGTAGSFPCRNLDLQSQIPLAAFTSQPLSAANVWGFVDLNDNRGSRERFSQSAASASRPDAPV
jgi:hypothetical protein